MPLPIPQKSTASHFYKYSSPANLGWLKDILHKHEIYLPNLTQLNDDNDGLPRLAMQSEQEMADFLWSKFRERNPNMSPQELEHEEKVIRFNVRLHGPAALHPSIVQLLDDQLKDFRVYSMAKRYDMGNLWALYADGHRGYCLEFENVGPMFEHAKDVNYLDLKDIRNSTHATCKTKNARSEAQKHVAVAKAILDKGTNPEQAQFFPYLQGYVAFYAGDYKTALEELLKANQNDPFIQCLIGQTYEKLGDKDKALEFYRKASAAISHNPAAAFAVPLAKKKLASLSN